MELMKTLLICMCYCILGYSTVELTYDPNGYVIFCLCMGRFGNQADHFLGAMAFAQQTNRTFVIPPFRTYKNVAFGEWFKVEALQKYHRAVTAEDFMKHIAPKYWPAGQRIGFCWLTPETPISECRMKEGNPFGPFWDELAVDFDSYEKYSLNYMHYKRWATEFPPDKYPVLAFKGAPAQFPVLPQHRFYQKYFQWSDTILNEVDPYIQKTFKNEKFIGLHLRNGKDWQQACEHTRNGLPHFMSSAQCLENTNKMVTIDICYPSPESILSQLKKVVQKTQIKNIFVATDQNTLETQIEEYLSEFNVKVYHMDPWLPVIDLAILSKSDYFIGNCVSSFTSFVKRDRDIHNKDSEFWGT